MDNNKSSVPEIHRNATYPGPKKLISFHEKYNSASHLVHVQLFLPRSFSLLYLPSCDSNLRSNITLGDAMPDHCTGKSNPHHCLSLYPALTTSWQTCFCVVCLILLSCNPCQKRTLSSAVHYFMAKFLTECIANSKDSQTICEWNGSMSWFSNKCISDT